MDQETFRLLEFDRVRDIVASMAQSAQGRKLALEVKPSREIGPVRESLALLGEAIRFSDEKDSLSFLSLADLTPILSTLSVRGEALSRDEFLLLRDCLELAKRIKRELDRVEWPLLQKAAGELPDPSFLLGKLDAKLDRNGEIRETAHPRLRELRVRQTKIRQKIESTLEELLSGPRSKFLIPDPYITRRNGRFVIPVRIEKQKEIPGIAHATSSSGATLFMEPFSCVDWNNELLVVQDQEQEILMQVLRELSGEFLSRFAQLEETVNVLANLDFLFACVAFSKRFRCSIPRLNEQGVLQLTSARHPLLLEGLGLDNVVPIAVRLDPRCNVLVISGPNTGGKTVALKTIGLMCLMAQSGLPVPAADVDIPFLESVLADIGDHQSITERLSTFSAHIARMKRFMTDLQSPSLILLDEVGRGTDPVYGAALGVAVMEFFRSRSCLVVATTHHQAVKSFAASTSGVCNAGVELDPATFRPTYRLSFGAAGSSSALEIASQLGLNKSVIARARELLDEKDLLAEQYLGMLRHELRILRQKSRELEKAGLRLEDEKRELAKKAEQAEQERETRFESMLEEWAAEFRRETDKQVRRFQDRFQAVRARQENRRRQALLEEAFRRRRKQKGTESPQGADSVSPEIRPGDVVYHSFFRKRGKVLSVDGRQAVIEIGGKKVETALQQLEKPGPGTVLHRPARNVTLQVVEQIESEINLIGNTVEEALPKIDKFLDRAFVSQLSEVRMIHGFGTGRLKQALAEALKSHPQVEAFELQGGVTKVTLKL